MVTSNSLPPPAFLIDGQPYERLGPLDHETLDGRRILLWRYRAPCAECGRPFILKTSRGRAKARSVARRCEDCRAPGRPVRQGAPLGAAMAPTPRRRPGRRPLPVEPAAARAFARWAEHTGTSRAFRRRDLVTFLAPIPTRRVYRWWKRLAHQFFEPTRRYACWRVRVPRADRSPVLAGAGSLAP